MESDENENLEVDSEEVIPEDSNMFSVCGDTPEARKGRPRRGRKRKCEEQTRADRKKLLNKNKKHINTRGEMVEPKIFDMSFICRCPKKCTQIVPLCSKLFTQFWDIGTHEGRCALLVSCVKELPKKRSYTKIPSKSTVTRKYEIFGQEVCKVTFLRTLQINGSRVDLAKNKQMHADSYVDFRGHSAGGWNALSQSKEDEVCAHITKFQRYVSHYTRSQTE